MPQQTFLFTKKALKDLECLEKKVQTMIIAKLEILKNETLLKAHLRAVRNLHPATHRIKIGSYRVLLEHNTCENKHLILKLGHRKEVYRSKKFL